MGEPYWRVKERRRRAMALIKIMRPDAKLLGWKTQQTGPGWPWREFLETAGSGGAIRFELKDGAWEAEKLKRSMLAFAKTRKVRGRVFVDASGYVTAWCEPRVEQVTLAPLTLPDPDAVEQDPA